jgi:nucleoside-diphosphate-sugar epimerase
VSTAFVTGGSGFVGGRLIARLVMEGFTVRALARSDAAAEKVGAAGAEPVRGDLKDEAAIEAGARGAETAFHAAAKVEDWGAWEDFRRVNVEGTRTALRACRRAGVRRFVHVGTEGALLHGQALVMADERTPLALSSKAPYAATKAAAEMAVLGASADGFDTVAIRPRFVWGAGDTTLLPVLVDLVRMGRFRWLGGGQHLTSTTHVDNTVHGLLLGAERGRPATAYFVTDGAPVMFREFVGAMIATQGVEPPDGSVPLPVGRALAAVGETAWRLLPLPGAPPLTRFALWASALECTLDDSRAREQLGYAPVITREEGLKALGA